MATSTPSLPSYNYLGFNLSPSATSGTGAYGQVPGQIGTPPSTWSQLTQNVPGFSNLTSSATGDIQSELSGQLSPSTMTNIGNYAAGRGVSLGVPNSPLSNLIGMNVTGTTTEQLQQAGLGNYNTLAATAGGMQLDPSLLTNIAQNNATMGAAPSPQAAAQEQQTLLQQYMAMMNPPSTTIGQPPAGYGTAGTGAGTSSYTNYLNLLGANIGAGAGANPFQVYNTGAGTNAGYYGSGGDNVDMSAYYGAGS